MPCENYMLKEMFIYNTHVKSKNSHINNDAVLEHSPLKSFRHLAEDTGV
jgi:hypothetical protein